MSPKKTIFLADDDPDMIAQLSAVLKSAGYNVVAAAGRQEAEELLLGVRPDLAILDLMMEQMDAGFVLSHHLRQLYPQTPIILLTAVLSATGISFAACDADARAWTQADRIMDKPVRPEELRAAVRQLLKEEDGVGHGDAKSR